MSIAAHFDALAAYDAAAVRLVPDDGEPEDLLGQGGSLQESFDRIGQGPLLSVLRDPRISRVTLADGDLEVTAVRDGSSGRLRVLWGQQTVVDERVEIPPLLPEGSGPWFRPDPATETGPRALLDPALPVYVVSGVGGEQRYFTGGLHGPGVGQVRLLAAIPPIEPGQLGSAAFRERHGLRQAYVVGAMAGGIASLDVCRSAADSGLLGVFGAGGLPVEAVETALREAASTMRPGTYGFNLLHNPAEPGVEDRTVDLFLAHGVTVAEASAFMGLTPAVVRFRLKGAHLDHDGRPMVPNRLFAKVSRPEIAEKFLRPAPAEMLTAMVGKGLLTEAEAAAGLQVPVAEDVTAEADSGGHTDHRPFVVLLPAMLRLRDRICAEEGYAARGIRPRIGAAGGLGTPASIAAAFAMGADYVLTGSVNQATAEAGTSTAAKEMLTAAAWWEMASGPAPDMFEIGAKVQVLGRGSMYAQRAQRLYDLYKEHGSLEALPQAERDRLEKQIFRRPLDEVWRDTRAFWMERDPRQAEKADADPRHRMALTFRWYLGMTSRWARTGEDDRKRDYQIWCGPAMGAFNDWVKGSELEPLASRTIGAVAAALMRGAAATTRVTLARNLGVALPDGLDPQP
ncbi:MAG: PfaD family polyunsaturated fatty acid/polyketide biosynthesis protein [Alphaproteobacteria bacterium]|nr:PfaD family polyunsaturated fatty acid/polyketide biosynthesis protein [Alphaproteobacteria bacterium]